MDELADDNSCQAQKGLSENSSNAEATDTSPAVQVNFA